MAASSCPNIVDEFAKISASLEEEFDESKGHQLALRDWSLLSNWIMQFIEEAKDVPDLVDEICDAPTLADRITLIVSVDSLRTGMETASEEMINVCERKEHKNVETSHILLSLGLRFLKLKNFEKALETFNRSLQICPHPQDMDITRSMKYRNMFSMILANRCRIFNMQNRYEQSLADLDLAIKYAVDPAFVRSLFDARELLVDEIRENVFDSSVYEPAQDGLENVFNNPNIHGAVASLKMAYKSRLGRHIVATAPIPKNISVISEKAYAYWLAPSYYDIYCAHCMQSLNDQPFPCRYCKYFRFCNEECYEEAWKEYHGIECKYMPVLKYFANAHLALRIVLMNGIEESIEAYYEVMSKQKFPVEARMVYRKRLKDILTLISHDHLIDKFMTTGTFTAAFLTIFVRSLGLIDEELIDDFGGLMLKLLAIIRVNSLLISDNTKRDEENDDFVSPKNSRAEIGAGLFGASSFINHSCDHNCNRTFIGNRMVISTNRDVEVGDEITITYGPGKDRLGYRERQAMIMDRYFFKCACRACVARM